MSTDVHAHFEIKVFGEWEHYSQPKIPKDYALFEKMAGVRGYVVNAIVAPRGVPHDVSITTRLCAEHVGVDGYGHSWFGLPEICEIIEYYPDERWGYLFGNCWTDINDRPSFIEDVRLIFWFDC